MAPNGVDFYSVVWYNADEVKREAQRDPATSSSDAGGVCGVFRHSAAYL